MANIEPEIAIVIDQGTVCAQGSVEDLRIVAIKDLKFSFFTDVVKVIGSDALVVFPYQVTRAVIKHTEFLGGVSIRLLRKGSAGLRIHLFSGGLRGKRCCDEAIGEEADHHGGAYDEADDFSGCEISKNCFEHCF